MNARDIVRALLLLLVFGSLGVFAWQRTHDSSSAVDVRSGAPDAAELGSAAPQTDASLDFDDPKVAADVLVTYFTTDVRCPSCRTIEELSRLAVTDGFPAELAAGHIAFRVVNTDRPENRHYLERYALTNKTVIISRQHEGREVEWTNRQDVWLHFHDPERFFAYVREPVQAYLAAH